MIITRQWENNKVMIITGQWENNKVMSDFNYCRNILDWRERNLCAIWKEMKCIRRRDERPSAMYTTISFLIIKEQKNPMPKSLCHWSSLPRWREFLSEILETPADGVRSKTYLVSILNRVCRVEKTLKLLDS